MVTAQRCCRGNSILALALALARFSATASSTQAGGRGGGAGCTFSNDVDLNCAANPAACLELPPFPQPLKTKDAAGCCAACEADQACSAAVWEAWSEHCFKKWLAAGATLSGKPKRGNTVGCVVQGRKTPPKPPQPGPVPPSPPPPPPPAPYFPFRSVIRSSRLLPYNHFLPQPPSWGRQEDTSCFLSSLGY